MFDARLDASDERRGSELRPRSEHLSFICAGSKFQTNNGNPNFAQLGPVPLGKLKNAYYKKNLHGTSDCETPEEPEMSLSKDKINLLGMKT